MLQNGYKSQENAYDLVYVRCGVTVKKELLDMCFVFLESVCNFSNTVKTRRQDGFQEVKGEKSSRIQMGHLLPTLRVRNLFMTQENDHILCSFLYTKDDIQFQLSAHPHITSPVIGTPSLVRLRHTRAQQKHSEKRIY